LPEDDARHGVVWLAQEESPGEGRPGAFYGYWEAAGGDGPVLEQVDELQTAEDALAWGRSRARCVLIRLARGDYFSAGVDPPEWGLQAPGWPYGG